MQGSTKTFILRPPSFKGEVIGKKDETSEERKKIGGKMKRKNGTRREEKEIKNKITVCTDYEDL